jgi:predicted membrane GTPase involved in stress response
MIVGENSRDDDLDVNASKPKKPTNVRSASADELVRPIPPRIIRSSSRSSSSPTTRPSM